MEEEIVSNQQNWLKCSLNPELKAAPSLYVCLIMDVLYISL